MLSDEYYIVGGLFPSDGFEFVDTVEVFHHAGVERLREIAEIPTGEKVAFHAVSFVSSAAEGWMAEDDIIIERPALSEDYLDVMRPDVHILHEVSYGEHDYDEQMAMAARGQAIRGVEWVLRHTEHQCVIADSLGRVVEIRSPKGRAMRDIRKVVRHAEQEKGAIAPVLTYPKSAWLCLRVVHRLFMDARANGCLGDAYKLARMVSKKVFAIMKEAEAANLYPEERAIRLERTSLRNSEVLPFWQRVRSKMLEDEYSVPRPLRKMAGDPTAPSNRRPQGTGHVTVSAEELERMLSYSAWPEWSEWIAPFSIERIGNLEKRRAAP